MAPIAEREGAWKRLAELAGADKIDAIARSIGLAEALALAPDLLEGKVRGRVVVDVSR
jgi:acrylyl-CoA reductase (NADPH)